ncbi:MAG: ABC transporter substrate-binding protein [Actinomycetota bacterium]
MRVRAPERNRALPGLAMVLAALLLAGACAQGVPPATTTALDDEAITIASFNFPESVLLGEIYAQALEGEGFAVKRQLGLGARELVEPSLQRGLVEFVPEYSGSALEFLTGGEGLATSNEGLTHDRLKEVFAERGVAVLARAPAQDQNGYAVSRQTADLHALRTITDLVPVAGELTFGGPPECPERSLCLEGLERLYGLEFGAFTPLDAGGPVTVTALRAGTVDVALLFTTDAAIDENDFVMLYDDLGLQPAENVTPVVRAEVVAAHGDAFVRLVDSVSALLTTEELRELNARVAEGESPKEVAAAWLAEHGLSGSRD